MAHCFYWEWVISWPEAWATSIPNASSILLKILNYQKEPIHPPIRSEIFGLQRFSEHGRSLGQAQTASRIRRGSIEIGGRDRFFPRLTSNIKMLRAAHDYLSVQASAGYDVSPAAEWLLDNFHLIEAQLKEVHEGLPLSYFRSLPVLKGEPLAGLPRIYGVAWAFVAHTDGAFEEEVLIPFLNAYQETQELDLGELWALPTTLRVVLIENLRRLAERVCYQSAAREVANLCCDDIDTCSIEKLDYLLNLLKQRGVGHAFVAQMAQRLQNRWGRINDTFSVEHEAWLSQATANLGAALSEQNAEQAADNISVCNAITSLRAVGDADWTDIVLQSNKLTQLMLHSKQFEAESDSTRNQTLQRVEKLALQSGKSEAFIAQTLVSLVNSASPESPKASASYWAEGNGRPELAKLLGIRLGAMGWQRENLKIAILPIYLGAILLGTLTLIAWLLTDHGWTPRLPHQDPWVGFAVAMLMIFPTSEAIVALVNRLISESVRPQKLPRLRLSEGVPLKDRVMVVIPAMLTKTSSIRELAHRLLLHYLANPEPYAQFAVLSDWVDSKQSHASSDSALLTELVKQIELLNEEYPAAVGDPARFIILHRERRYSRSEQAWIGWERKRGKLELLISVLAGGKEEHIGGELKGMNVSNSTNMAPDEFLDLGKASQIALNTKYVLTLDSDTQLPPGRLRELVAVALHPLNQPRLDSAGHQLLGGYAILQPRVATPLAPPKEVTFFHWLFAGQTGVDPYSAATSEVYQDLFREGTFSGKGLLHVQATHALLSKRLPDESVLSHDLLEGSIARCAVVTDVTVLEHAPFHADVAASRAHRWIRGDWQLLPFLLRARRYHLSALSRWKIFDNLRRSLVAPMSLALFICSLAGVGLTPSSTLMLILSAYCGGPLIGAIAGLATHREDLSKTRFMQQGAIDLTRALLGGVWHLVQLLQNSLLSLDAIVRALYRMIISRQNLLQWTTADSASASAKSSLLEVILFHRKEPILASILLVGLLFTGTPYKLWSIAFCALWAAAPIGTWWSIRSRSARLEPSLAPEDTTLLNDIARDTWRMFERCITSNDQFLPPDNFQTVPYDMIAHRTSPTNIGLYLLSAVCAREFGWIGTIDLIHRLEQTLGTLETLPRHRGHFFNWYNTQTGEVLSPKYVSTVDSGNLSGHLLAVAQACIELGQFPIDFRQARRALQISQQRLIPLLIDSEGAISITTGLATKDSAIKRVLALSDPLAEAGHDPQNFLGLLVEARDELALDELGREATTNANAQATRRQLEWCLVDHVSMLISVVTDLIWNPDQSALTLKAIAARCQKMAWEADFKFLYHRKRHLFHIGYRVAEQELDASFYDLVASECRLTSLLAIAKGDVASSHWATLGRPFYALGIRAALRSWSGSMFEYLMPGLVLNEPHGSMLRGACEAAVREQFSFAKAHNVPWGISESAYSGRDNTLAYQYSPQGVPRLAIRRTPSDELVVAPYATALAAQIDAKSACENFRALAALCPATRYGFVESLDFTSARQSEGRRFTPVYAFMAHHQGMTIVALANTLLEGCAQRWAMNEPRIEAVASILQEKAPREISTLHALMPGRPISSTEARAPSFTRDVSPGGTAIEPTHLLSNGTYSVAVRANGAGWSRWGKTGVTRWRDDALRDEHGSFFFLRWNRQPKAVSLTLHPAPDPAAHYHSIFHIDRVRFEATWSDLKATTSVWVSPEDDIEFRQIELVNLSSKPLELELLSVIEPTLTEPGADEAHPAFSNLFIGASWVASDQAILLQRTPRLSTERAIQVAHFIAQTDPNIQEVKVQTDRRQWLGRNGTASSPRAMFYSAAESTFSAEDRTQENIPYALDTGLDPVAALSVRIRIPTGSKAQLTFCTAAHDDPAKLRTVVDKYRQASHVQRASLMSGTLTNIRLRSLSMRPDKFAAIQSLTTSLVVTLTKPRLLDSNTSNSLASTVDRQRIWRFGISGDLPIVLIFAGIPESLGLVRSFAQALQIWTWGGVPCDLVVINREPASYEMALQREMAALRDRHLADTAHSGNSAATGFHLLRADELTSEELGSLQALSRLKFLADGRPLVHHVQALLDLHESDFDNRHEGTRTPVGRTQSSGLDTLASRGDFYESASEFRFQVSADSRPRKPWINVLSNPQFGAQISESGGGYTWAGNSRLNQLTAWSNDAVADPPSEWFLIQDRRTLKAWSISPSAWAADKTVYRVTHGQGYTTIEHECNDLKVSASWCVDEKRSVKHVNIRVRNTGSRTQHLRLIGMVEWAMGANRSARSTTHTTIYREDLPRKSQGSSYYSDQNFHVTATLCTQQDYTSGFGGGTAFLAAASSDLESEDWTCDRREFFDARGSLVLPLNLAERSGNDLDPCAALSLKTSLNAGDTLEQTFLMGYGSSDSEARKLALEACLTSPQVRLEQVRQQWNQLLGATQVKTPDPLFDAMVNRWLIYQTVSSRLWAKAGFFQAGGAIGYRDQLQDAMALSWARPEMLRDQILLAASRQFPEGDVQHWWHMPTGAGVRTHFSDDLLWLAYALLHYLRVTGDTTLLNQEVHYIEGIPIPPGAEDSYSIPTISEQKSSVFEHAARAIDKSLKTGVHGLPLMGSGDWNDGMNRVGHLGHGESVWLGWFLCLLVADMAPLARTRQENARADTWEAAATDLKSALGKQAWDGNWFKRAFFDNGLPLGSSNNPEAKIDLIAQAWSVLSNAAPIEQQMICMASVEARLVDQDAGLIRLLTPPLKLAEPSAGYIQAYPPGIRENGGQYSHGAVWALMAQAELARKRGGTVDGTTAYRYFKYLSPAHRAIHPKHGPDYEIEPYVMAGDVYTSAPYTGRGGWSWYTGAAAWMHRAATESIFGLTIGPELLTFKPCLPLAWSQVELILHRDTRVLHFILCRLKTMSDLEARASQLRVKLKLDAHQALTTLKVGDNLQWPLLRGANFYLVPVL